MTHNLTPTTAPARFWDAQQNRAVRNIATVRDRVLTNFGLSSSEWFVLDVAHAAYKTGIAVGEIARIVDVQTTYTALVLRRLQAKKLVRTELSKKDRRVHLVYLTDAGVKVLQDSETALKQAFSVWADALSREDRKTYGQAINVFATSVPEV